MIEKIKNFKQEEIYHWLKNEAGVNNGQHFGAFEGGLELQQIPEEYCQYLNFLQSNNFESYMNIGIGNGGSFMVETYIQPNLKRSVAVDNTSYGRFTNMEHINQRINWLKENTDISIEFFNMNSKDYFDTQDEKFDIIFIDGDHEYEGVKLDYDNCVNRLNEGGYLVFHDIHSYLCAGVVKLWNEIKNPNCIEFIFGPKCGIGLWRK
jgi:precorrin-6B methylase 2